MDPHRLPSVAVCRPGSDGAGSESGRIVVWVRGDQDVSTRGHLSAAIARAARLDDTDMVVDLGGVTFMDASTINSLVEAYEGLRARSRSLSLRAPSPLARRLLDICELGFLIDADPAPSRPPVASALDSWVAVPASDQRSSPAQTPVQRPAPEPALPATQRRAEPAGSVPQDRSPP